MNSFSRFTKQMQSMLPQWMEMAKKPESVGAQFLNVFGLEFEDVQTYLEEALKSMHIGTADLSQIDIVYKVPISVGTLIDLDAIDSVSFKQGGVHYPAQLKDQLRFFYDKLEDTSVAIIDRKENMLYLRLHEQFLTDKEHPVEEVMINGNAHYEYYLHHIWNFFDEFGLLLGLYRNRGERNADFKDRILDVFINPANSTKNGLLNGLARELGLSKEEISINELNDTAFHDSLLNEDGSASNRLIQISEKINKLLGFTWDNMSWDEAYWYSVEDTNLGLKYLPHVWDASTVGWEDQDFQSGIGDGNDLKVTAPQEQENFRTFKYLVGLRGKQKGKEMISPEMSFNYKITAKGYIEDENYTSQSYKYTIVASEIVPLHFLVQAFKQYLFTTTINFDTAKMNFKYDSESDSSLEILKSNQSLEPAENNQIKVRVEMETTSKSATPQLNDLTVVWLDSTGATQRTKLTTQAELDGNSSTVFVEKINVLTTTGGSVELGYGDFYQKLDSKEDWKQGQYRNVSLTEDGSIRLTPIDTN